jgi:hypothetical protein
VQRHPERRQVAVAESEEDYGRHPKAAPTGPNRSRHVGMSASRVSLFIHDGADGITDGWGQTDRSRAGCFGDSAALVMVR